MAERVEFGVPVAALKGAPESADRFVYLFRFAALTNDGDNGRPVLAKAQWVYLAKAAGLTGDPVQEWKTWHTTTSARLPGVDNTVRLWTDVGTGHVYAGGTYAGAAGAPASAEGTVSAPGGTYSVPGGTVTVPGGTYSAPGAEMPIRVRPGEGMEPGQPVERSRDLIDERGEPFVAVLTRTEQDVLLELARSEIGLLFLDRTRLRPAGFVVGEHLHTIGLAAGEEVVLEQRSFVQRETVDETSTEAERTEESEASASWTMDRSDVIAGTLTTTRTDGFTAGGSVGFEYGAKASINGGQSSSTTDADNDTRTNSVKEVAARTAKNAAKLRDLHKTVFRVSATDRFERSARRTVRNPNPHTPIDLHFFKVLQRIRFSYERFGVRLCWTPFIRDPAGDFFVAETKMREALLKRARDSVPAAKLPPQPVISAVPGARIVGLDPPMTELKQWGGWPGSDMSADYTLPINVPSGMKWDGDSAFLQGSLRATLTGAERGFNVYTVGDPWEVINANGDRAIFQIVHAGATWRLTGSSQLWVSLSARVIPDTTSLSQEQAKAMAEWEATCAALLAERAAKVAAAEAQALEEFEVWRAAHRATLNPARELMRRFISAMFPADARDEVAELDVWEQVFDWDLASARLYPGTWTGDGQLRDPSRPADDFVNASWARLYLPVRTGFEDIALRWIFLRSRTAAGPPAIEALIAKVLKEITDWRQQHLGGPDEVTVTPVPGQLCPQVEQRYICLGTWTDDLPTDGVHTEVTQATSSAADSATAAIAAAESQRTAAVVATLLAEAKVNEAVARANLKKVDVHLHLSEQDQ